MDSSHPLFGPVIGPRGGSTREGALGGWGLAWQAWHRPMKRRRSTSVSSVQIITISHLSPRG